MITKVQIHFHHLGLVLLDERIRRSALGPPPVWRSKLTAAKLGKAIYVCTGNRSHGQKAMLVGQTIRRENGVQQTMQAILAS